MDFPEISGVPVMFPQSKNVTIAWPIKKGDGCLLVFSEQALDYWMYGKETDTKLKFDLTNAIAIPNLTSGGNSTMKLACDEDAVAIAAGDTTNRLYSSPAKNIPPMTMTAVLYCMNVLTAAMYITSAISAIVRFHIIRIVKNVS